MAHNLRTMLTRLGVILTCLLLPALAAANTVVIRDARIFDGVNDQLSSSRDVLVVNGLIDSIGPSLSVPEGTKELCCSCPYGRP